MDGNPYAPPNDTNDSPRPEYAFDRRCAFLCLPPSIPLIVHAIVRLSIPVEETLYHGLFTLGAIIPSWFWSQTMIDRLRLSMWKTFLVTTFVWSVTLASAFFAPTIISWIASRI